METRGNYDGVDVSGGQAIFYPLIVQHRVTNEREAIDAALARITGQGATA